MENKIVYYAHPITHYNTEHEIKCEKSIREKFNNVEIFNPNMKWLNRVYQNRKDEGHEKPFGIFQEIAKVADIVVGCTFEDGKLGSGVFGECVSAYSEGKEVYIMFYDMTLCLFSPMIESLTIEETKERTNRKEM